MINKIANLRKFWPKFFLTQIIIVSLFFVLSFTASAQTKEELTKSLDFTPQISIPNSEFDSSQAIPIGIFDANSGELQSDLLARYILAIFNYALAIVGILATVVLMGGGIIWLTSSGDSGKITKAKQLMGGALTGLILLACSWIILNTINPELTKLQSINVKVANPVNIKQLICCDPARGAVITKIKEENGKKIALEGDLIGKEIRCSATAPECGPTQTCSNAKEEKYTCLEDDFCCYCKKPASLNEIGIQEFCKNNVTQADCINWCTSLKGAYGSSGKPTLYPGKNKCGTDNKCSL